MNFEKSCGAVVFVNENNSVRYLLMCSMEGVYGFPKGHMEGNETEIETALREVREETNVHIRLVGDFRADIEYMLQSKKDTLKHVTYFLATYDGDQTVIPQEGECCDVRLVSYEEAMALLPYERTQQVLKQANDYLLAYLEGTKA